MSDEPEELKEPGERTGSWIVTGVIAYICCALIFGLFASRPAMGGLFWLPAILIGGLILVLIAVVSIVWIMGDEISFDPFAPGE